jgi:hypothetical protein
MLHLAEEVKQTKPQMNILLLTEIGAIGRYIGLTPTWRPFVVMNVTARC